MFAYCEEEWAVDGEEERGLGEVHILDALSDRGCWCSFLANLDTRYLFDIGNLWGIIRNARENSFRGESISHSHLLKRLFEIGRAFQFYARHIEGNLLFGGVLSHLEVLLSGKAPHTVVKVFSFVWKIDFHIYVSVDVWDSQQVDSVANESLILKLILHHHYLRL